METLTLNLMPDKSAEDIVIEVEPICYDMPPDSKSHKPSTSKEDEESLDSDAPLSKYQVFQCPVCKKFKKDRRDLKSHARIHTRNHECPHCEDRFFCKTSDLHRHLRTNHGAIPTDKPEKVFICEICGNSFKEAYYLKKHRMSHQGIKPHSCSFCSESFRDRNSLTVHERRHTGEKPYSCTECGKSFPRRNSLNRHMLWHRDERPWECSVCNQRCSTRSRLQSHMISHTKERAFECDICHIKLAHKSSIRPHKRSVHNVAVPGKHELQGRTPDESTDKAEEEKSFTCPVCSKEFKSRKPSHITRHMLIHSKQKPFKCAICDKRFTQKSSLKEHKRRVHQQMTTPDSELKAMCSDSESSTRSNG